MDETPELEPEATPVKKRAVVTDEDLDEALAGAVLEQLKYVKAIQKKQQSEDYTGEAVTVSESARVIAAATQFMAARHKMRGDKPKQPKKGKFSEIKADYQRITADKA